MNSQISPQYITKDKINVTILDVIDPAHYVVKESADLLNASSKARNFLEAEEAMQRYYASVEPCFFQLPLKDAIVVVLHNEKFYRAKVIRILTLSSGHLFKVYLVDYGIECSIGRENIYEIEKDFLDHPFQAVNFKLLGIEPISLVISQTDLTIAYGPVPDWDQSAEIYIRDLKKNVCSAYIEVQGIDDLHIYGRLFIEDNHMKCINDDLVSKSYARFNEECWKSIKKIENVLGNSDVDVEVAAVKSNISENANLEQVPGVDDSSDTKMHDEFKMMFINPSGKIVAESSLTKNSAGNLPLMEDESMLQDEAAKEVTSDLEKSLNKSPSKSEELTSEAKMQLLAEKRLQKLMNKKKRLSSVRASSDNNANNDNPLDMNKTIENCAVPLSESSCTVITNEVDVKNCNENNRLMSSVNNDKRDVECSSENNKMNTINQTLNQNELIKSPAEELKSLLSPESNILKDTVCRTEGNSEAENITQAQLIAQKRLLKLQLKRKSQSPVSAKTSPPSSAISSTEKLEPIKTSASDISFSDQHCQSQPSSETVPESSESSPRQEVEIKVVSENQRQFEKLQRKVRLKKEKESLKVLQKPSTELTQMKEISVETSCNSSLCDSDSGLNSCSSSPSASDRGHWCCLQ